MADTRTPTRWTLTDLLTAPEGEPLERHLRDLEQALQDLEAGRPRLTADIAASEFSSLLHTYERIAAISRRLGAYAYLWFSEDTQNQAALNLQGRLDQVLVAAHNRALFFELWFKGLPDEAAQRLIESSGDERYFLESLRRLRPFTLSEPEERVIALKDANGIDALVNLYDMLTSQYSFSLQVEGETKTLTQDELMAYCRHPAPEVRAAAYQELYRVYRANSTVLAQIYNHRVRDWHAEMLELRHFAEPISARNTMNDLPDPVVDTLLEVCRRNAGVFQRYFGLKARWLKLGKLRRYDIYAPLSPSEKRYGLDEAVDLVLESLEGFSREIAGLARRVFDERHLDATPRPGKRGGAYCYGVLPGLTPWILTNFTGRARDVPILAHELGHAVHAMMAADHSVLTYNAPLPLAETASVFGEMLLTDLLLQREHDPAVRRELLASVLDDGYATVLRQAYFTLFERDAHRLIDEGKTIEEVASHYYAALEEQFGSAVELSDEFRWEWIVVPHFYHAPFYTYAYSFGQLLVLALYQRYRAEGKAFLPRYRKILAYGGSASPAHILAEAGIDISDPGFWQGGFDFISGLITDLEGLEGPS